MKKILLASLALLALSGCNKQPGEIVPTGEDVSLMLIPTTESVGELTRAAVTGTQFMHGNQVGFSILKTGTATPHFSGYKNIMARGVSSVSVTSPATNWFYYVNGAYMGPTLGGNSGLGNIDVFGYYPYDVEMDNIESVPFDIGTTIGTVTTATETEATTDYMWAVPKSNVDISVATNVPIQMNFNHLMTCLEFGLNKQYYGPELTVESIKFEISGDNGRKFTTAGTYNAKTGAITGTPNSTQIAVAYSNKTISNGDPNKIVYMQIIMPELKYSVPTDEATITATFTFKTNALWSDDEPLEPAVYTFTLSQVKEGATSTGLEAGKRYQVRATVSNYTKFLGSPVVAEEGFTNVDTGYDNHIGI